MNPPRKEVAPEAVAEEPEKVEAAAPEQVADGMCNNHPDREALYRSTTTAANTIYFCEECARRTGEGIEMINPA